MNFINRFFLKIVFLPSGLYRKMGVNENQLRSILGTKLMMDDRRLNPVQQARRKSTDKPVKWATLGTMLVSTFLGLIYLLAFAIGKDPITHLTVYFTFFFLMLSASLISDFTSVLIDIRDNFIILPKPVNDSTLILGRLLHIFIHICKLVLPMSLPGFIAMVWIYGWIAALAFLILIFFVTVFAIFFINAVYIIILRITTPQRFQTIISYIQIIFAIFLYASYQIFPRMIDADQILDFDVSNINWISFYPLYWFACGWRILTFSGINSTEIIPGLLGFILPVISLYLVVKYLAPSFNNKLALIHSSVSKPQDGASQKISKGPGSSYSSFLGKIFTRTKAEKMGFLFTWKMTSRSRDFKLKVYPSIGYLIVYIVVMFVNRKNLSVQDIADQDMKGRFIIISALYFTSLLLTMALNQIIYSEKFKASWIYYVSPVKTPGEIILGSAKAAILKFYIPIVLFITVTGIIIVGPSILPNIILGLLNELLIATILVYVRHKIFPFSVQQNADLKTSTFIRSIMVLFISAIIALGHFLIYDYLPAVILCTVLSLIATWLMMSGIKQTSWEVMKGGYSE